MVKLRQELKAAGVSPGRADGVFGAGTLRALKTFQARHHLAADGVAGPNTWRALLNDGKKPGGATAPRKTTPAAACTPLLRQSFFARAIGNFISKRSTGRPPMMCSAMISFTSAWLTRSYQTLSG